MRLCLAGVGFLLLLTSTGVYPSQLQGQLEHGVELFYEGYRAWDRERLSEAVNLFQKVCETAPEDYLAHYWLGVARFHVLVHRQGDTKRSLENREFGHLLRETRKALEKAAELKQSDSEAHALLGTLAGMEIARHPSHALWLGPAVLRHKRHALRHGPDNPRVHYLLGAAFVQGPGFLGGAEKGLPHLLRAAELFQVPVALHGKPRASAPTWGHEHCLTLLGQTYEHLGNLDKAAQYFRNAIALNPQNKLAQRRLDMLKRGTGSDE